MSRTRVKNLPSNIFKLLKLSRWSAFVLFGFIFNQTNGNQFTAYAYNETNSDLEASLMSRPFLTQNGQLFVIQFTPKSRRVDVLAAGKSIATLDPSSVRVFGRVYPRGGNPRDLSITWSSGFFKISDPIEDSTPIELEVSDRATSKSETFRFDKYSPADPIQIKESITEKKIPSVPVSPR